MRRFWQSTEYWTTLILSVLFMLSLFSKSPVNVLHHSIMLSVLLNSYTISRCLFKRNRGLFYTGLQTSELHFTLVQYVWFFSLLYLHKLDNFHALLFILIAQIVYNLCRGMTKAIGSKTSILIR